MGRIDVLTAQERQQLLVEWNPPGPQTEPGRIPDIFEARVAQAPDTVALTCDDQQLTYGELNARANQLARLLIAEGVGPEQMVALALPRSSTSSSEYSVSSRPVPHTCRSTRTTPPTDSPTPSTTPSRPAWSPPPPSPANSPHRHTVCAVGQRACD
ncbi:AMP-binding protein [Streptomyces sp. M10(2022)]